MQCSVGFISLGVLGLGVYRPKNYISRSLNPNIAALPNSNAGSVYLHPNSLERERPFQYLNPAVLQLKGTLRPKCTVLDVLILHTPSTKSQHPAA